MYCLCTLILHGISKRLSPCHARPGHDLGDPVYKVLQRNEERHKVVDATLPYVEAFVFARIGSKTPRNGANGKTCSILTVNRAKLVPAYRRVCYYWLAEGQEECVFLSVQFLRVKAIVPGIFFRTVGWMQEPNESSPVVFYDGA